MVDAVVPEGSCDVDNVTGIVVCETSLISEVDDGKMVDTCVELMTGVDGGTVDGRVEDMTGDELCSDVDSTDDSDDSGSVLIIVVIVDIELFDADVA